MARRKDFLDEYASDSSSNSGSDDLENPDDHRRKRRRTARNVKESAALGVFGSESEDEGRGAWKPKNLRGRGVGFVSAGQNAQEEEDEEYPEEDEGWYQEEEERPRLGLGGGRAYSKFTKAKPAASTSRDDAEGDEEDKPRVGLRGRLAFTQFSKASSGASTPAADDGDSDRPRLGFGGRSFTKFTKPADSGAATPQSEGHPGLGFSTPFGRGFVSSAATAAAKMPKLSATPPPNGETPVVRPSAFGTPVDPKKKDAAPTVNPNSFAARMMAKMGYKLGQGLGKEGQGRLEPVAQKVRPQGVGVGAVREMSEQEKKEARRAAKLRGEGLSDSESEKRKANKKGRDSTASGSSTPRFKKEKQKFRTAEEITANAKGLEVPSALKNIIDFTEKAPKTLASASGLMVQQPSATDDNMKLARVARRDLELFAGEWKGLQDRKTYLSREESNLNSAVDDQSAELKRLQDMVSITKQLQSLSVNNSASPEYDIEALVTQLEVLQFEFKQEIASHNLSEVAVAVLHPLFKAALQSWDPLTDPFFYRDHFHRLKLLLGIRAREALESEYSHSGYLERSKFTTPYETLICSLWLPKVRAAINNDWDVHHPAPLLSLLDMWAPVLPAFVYSNILISLVLPKLRTAVQTYNPRKSKRSSAPPPPHLWVFQWLPCLGPHMEELLRDMRTKFGVLLETWHLSAGPINGLEAWREVFGADKLEATLIRHLLPRLALLLSTSFIINPADQDLIALETVFKWTSFFRPSTFARLFTAEFFPKWLDILHQWLTSTPDFNEVQEWYLFWQDVFPEPLRSSPIIQDGFRKGLDMVNDALDLGSAAATELPPPAAGPEKPITAPAPAPAPAAAAAPLVEPPTFRDAVEDWCAEHNLLLVPLRKAHEATGSPLFRITASASGGGGVVVYFRGDVVWVQKKRERAVFEPVSLAKVLESVEGGG